MQMHERAHAVRDVFGQRDGRVVARGQQQPVQQRLQAHVVADREHAHLRPGHVRRPPGDQHRFIGRGVLDGQQRRHHLGEARDAHLLQGSRCHSTWPVFRLNSRPGAGRPREGEVDGIQQRRAEAAQGHRGCGQGEPVGGQLGRRGGRGVMVRCALGPARFAVPAHEGHAEQHRHHHDRGRPPRP